MFGSMAEHDIILRIYRQLPDLLSEFELGWGQEHFLGEYDSFISSGANGVPIRRYPNCRDDSSTEPECHRQLFSDGKRAAIGLLLRKNLRPGTHCHQQL